ncbi:centrosomal protein of 126 kDa isoform X2 [Hemiscyllium ocellatum]|uniref:centrosomal protein of 126 kDa isoform X2 n=1 Tax=Hemiscyllium ocellatum TaxID=170820 RepID=UPI00296765EC|nr:centrosomal protein of 126 kDa isoform X2 [Hemiscyllium ocellatum]
MWRERPLSSLNIKTQLEGLDEERQRLSEEQKLNRAKVRKLSLQTIRRRKALEEKRRDNAEKEQKLREEVLHERKLKQQDATERFQRAHLPPSQRRQNRIGQRKRATQLEEALEQIQGSPCGSASLSPVVTKPTVNKGATDSLLNLSTHETRSSRYQQQLSEAKAYAKLMQERSGADLQNSRLRFQQELEETQRLLGEQQLNSLQEFRHEIDQLYRSESLSSLDSLETVEQITAHQTEPNESHSLNVQNHHTPNNTMKPHPPVNHSFNSFRRDFYPLKKTHTSSWINYLDSSKTSVSSAVAKTNETEAPTTIEDLSDKLHTSASANIKSECFDSSSLFSVERYQNECSTKFYNKNQRKIVENNSHSIESQSTSHPSSKSSFGHIDRSATRLCSAWSTPDPTPREATQVSDLNDRLESVQQNEPATLHSLKLPLATPFFLTFSPKSQLFSDGTKTDSIKGSQKIVQQNHLLACIGAANQMNQNADNSSKSEDTSPNKYNLSIKNRHDSEGASQKLEPSQVKFNSSGPDSEKNVTEGKENKLAAHSAVSTTRLKGNKKYFYEKSNFTLLKGILKKVSKYENCYPKSLLSATGVLGIQMASSIRDSVELIKLKEAESVKKTTKKKLRWFDEIEQNNQFTKEPNEDTGKILEDVIDGEYSGSDGQSQLHSPSLESNVSFSNGNSIVDRDKESKWTTLKTSHKTAVDCSLSGHQQTETRGAITVTDPVILEAASMTNGITPAVPPQYHLTKQAWAAIRTRNIDQKITEKPMVRKGHTKVIKRTHSAKIYFCRGGNCRKGTIIRPQSASEAMKSQGKMLVPYPPPRTAIDSKQCQRSTGNFNTSCQSQVQPANVVDNSSTKSKEFIPDVHYTSSEDNADKTAVSRLWSQRDFSNQATVTITTFPSSYLLSPYETVTKAAHSVNTTKSVLQQDDVSNDTKQDPRCGENRLHLDCTPTDEEVALLWHRVRSDSAQKDATNGYSRNYLSPRNSGHKTNLQPHRTNVSQLNIDGGNLLSGVRSVSRLGRLLSAPSAFAGRNHPMDTHSNGIKHRALLQQRRMNIGSTHKSDQTRQNIQISPFPSTFDPVLTINAAQNTEEAVSQSTEQFMLAENMVETSALDSDILSAMETIETQRYSFLQNKVQQLGLSALSFEEQQLLQSLDRLNQRLQYIKEIVQTSPSNDLLQIPSPFVTSNGVSSSSIKPGQAPCGTHKDQSLTPDHYGQFQRKY